MMMNNDEDDVGPNVNELVAALRIIDNNSEINTLVTDLETNLHQAETRKTKNEQINLFLDKVNPAKSVNPEERRYNFFPGQTISPEKFGRIRELILRWALELPHSVIDNDYHS